VYTRSQPINNTGDDPLYQSQRYGNFTYTIPIVNGSYAVTLKFAELYWGSPGRRVFDVVMEGQKVISNLDVVAHVGTFTAHEVTIPVTVTDGALTLTFISRVDLAIVNAIVVSASGPPPPPDTTPPSTPTNLTATATSSSQISLSWTASTDNVGVTGYRLTRNGTTLSGTISGTSTTESGLTPATAYTYTVQAVDAAGNVSTPSASASATTPEAPSNPTMAAVNVGGAAVTAADGTSYQADTGFSGGTVYAVTHAIAGTSDPNLYRSQRYGNFTYTIPVANGSYAVTLQFAELYHGNAGQRVFDVLLEGQEVISNLDVVARAGAFTGNLQIIRRT
jgi:chitodextrinase